MKDIKKNYQLTSEPQIHIKRHKEIVAKYPKVKDLHGPYFPTFFWILFLVGSQFVISYLVNESSWALIVAVAFFIGAFFNHALFVMIHECTHNLVFKKRYLNKCLGIFCDFVLIIPSAMGFRKYHMIHHRHLGEYEMDPDVCSYTEGKLIGNSKIMKTLWLFCFSISQSLRPMKIKSVKVLNSWIIANLIVQIAVNYAIYFYLGPKALIYLIISTVFALGLHPLGGRWIQEHYVTEPGQETYSYYGPLNLVTFNMGFHNEHHDFMNIPWVRLPALKKLAPDYYDTLKSYKSWTGLVIRFIFDKNMGPFTRIVHPSTLPKKQNDSLRETESAKLTPIQSS